MQLLTRKDIMDAIPTIPIGSFWYWIFRAGVKSLPGEVRNGRFYKLFPADSIKKIRAAMAGGER